MQYKNGFLEFVASQLWVCTLDLRNDYSVEKKKTQNIQKRKDK